MQKLIDFLIRLAEEFRLILGASEKMDAQTFPEKINAVYEKGFLDGETDLTELITLQESYIYRGNDDVLHVSVDENGDLYNGKGYKEDTDWDNSTKSDVAKEGNYLTGYIPIKSGDTIYLKNIPITKNKGSVYFWANSIGNQHNIPVSISNVAIYDVYGYMTQFTIPNEAECGYKLDYMRLSTEAYTGVPIITINKPIGGIEI